MAYGMDTPDSVSPIAEWLAKQNPNPTADQLAQLQISAGQMPPQQPMPAPVEEAHPVPVIGNQKLMKPQAPGLANAMPAPTPDNPPQTQDPMSGLNTQYSDLLKQLGSAESKGLGQQDQGIQNIQDAIDKIKNKPEKEGLDGINLTPFLNLYDSWYGGHMSQGYKPPETEEDKDNQVLALNQALQKSRGQYTADEISMIKTKLGITEKAIDSAQRHEDKQDSTEAQQAIADAKLDMAKTMLTNRQAGAEDKQNQKQDEVYSKAEEATRMTRGTKVVSDSLGQLKQIKNANSYVNMFKSPDDMTNQEYHLFTEELARIAANGASSDNRVAALTAKTIQSQLAGKLEWVEGQPQPAGLGAFIRRSQKYLKELQDNNQEVVNKNVHGVYNSYSDRFTPQQDAHFKLSNPEAFPYVTDEEWSNLKDKYPQYNNSDFFTKKQPMDFGQGPTPEEAKAELARRGSK